MKNHLLSVSIDMGEAPNISEALQNFVTQDGMEGFQDLQFMLKDEKLSKKVPDEIRKEFEELFSKTTSHIEQTFTDMIKELEESRSKANEFALKNLQNLLECQVDDNKSEADDENVDPLVCVILPI